MCSFRYITRHRRHFCWNVFAVSGLGSFEVGLGEMTPEINYVFVMSIVSDVNFRLLMFV